MIKFDVLNFVFGVIDIIVFYLLMKKFLFGRIKKVIDARKELVSSQLKEAEEKNAEADKKLVDYEEKIAGCKAECEDIIKAAKVKANNEYNRIISDAEADADKLKADAEKQIQEDTAKAMRDSKEEFASLAIEAAEKVIGSSVSAKTDSAIFDEFLNGEGND
ncbi:MAG: F0F1 ATP synthase subunit B [Eubacterium sp.]|nr:F0F1 ATP synthase subunit B [Eubacterium sp.]